MKRQIVITAIAVLVLTTFTGHAFGQDRLSAYASQLSIPSGTGAKAVVRHEADVEAWLARYGVKSSKVSGYRVCIYSGNSQDARAKASGMLGAFRSRFPGISGEALYNAPTWKVVVGNCLTLTEATILLGKIRQDVSANAFLFREEFDAAKALEGFHVSAIVESPPAESEEDPL